MLDTFRKARARVALTDARSRFAAVVLGAVLASLVWLVCVLTLATTPNEARDRRAAPALPAPNAQLVEQDLRQLTWYPCAQDIRSEAIGAPAVPPGQRSVVTHVAEAGTPVRTGTRLGSVGDVPIIAVVTDGVFYRDLSPGDTGPDVRAFNAALQERGLIAQGGSVLGGPTVSAWRDRFDSTGPANLVRLSTLAAVPRHGSVRTVNVLPGDDVKPGTALMEIGAGANGFVCDVPDPSGEITPSSVTLQVDGQEVKAASVTVRARTRQAPGSIAVIPATPSSTDSAMLAIEATSSAGPVLTAPLSAVRTAPDGGTIVTVIEDGDRRDVPVSLGVSAQGWVEIEGSGLTPDATVALFDQALTTGSASQPQP